MGLFSSLFGGKKSLDTKSEAPYPSWKDDKNKLSEHFAIMIEWAESRNVPIKFVQGLTQTEYSRNKMLFTAGLLERQGSSFEQQNLAILDYIERVWSNMDLDDKKNFKE